MSTNNRFVIGLLVFQAMLAGIILATPESLGLPPVVVAWMGILNVGVGVLLNRLEALGGKAALGDKAP